MPRILSRLSTNVTLPGDGWSPAALYVRESTKKPGVLVIGAEFNGTHKRIALVRVNDDNTVTVRTLDGDPQEPSSEPMTQTRLILPVSELTDDQEVLLPF